MKCPHCERETDSDSEKCKYCEKEMDSKDKIPPSTNIFTSGILWLSLILLVPLCWYVYQLRIKPLFHKIPPATVQNSDSSEFFRIIIKEIQETDLARYHFGEARKIILSNESSGNFDAEQYFPAAENFARSLERFKHTRQVIEGLTHLENEKSKSCKNNLAEILEKYIDATNIFNEYAKDLSQGKLEQAQHVPLTDGKAKYEIADQLMSAFLLDGCKGSFFTFLKTAAYEDKRLAFVAYKSFYQEKFPSFQYIIESLMNYKTPPESLPISRPFTKSTSAESLPLPHMP